MSFVRTLTLIIVGLVLSSPRCARAQDQQGPIPPPPKFEVHRIPSVPHPGPPPIPQQEIIQRFAANEDVMAKIYKTYTFTQTVRVEDMSGTGPGGMFSATGQVYTKPDGRQFWRIIGQPQSTLKTTTLTLEDVRTIATLPLFFLTSAEIGNYSFLYAGQDKLDELNAYVFQVKPKQLSRTHRYFEGAIWVEDHDLTIVKTYGKFVSEVESDVGTKLPFTMFETYRENFQEKYWLPTYTNSDDFITASNGDQFHLRLVIHSTDFKPNPQSGGPAPTSSPG
jgi:G:T/U-mismatch repair DNA glycosylase